VPDWIEESVFDSAGNLVFYWERYGDGQMFFMESNIYDVDGNLLQRDSWLDLFGFEVATFAYEANGNRIRREADAYDAGGTLDEIMAWA
jgi:hypothetical protein